MFANVFAAVSHVASALFRMGDSLNRLTDSFDGLAGKIEAQVDRPLVIDASLSPVVPVVPVNRLSSSSPATPTSNGTSNGNGRHKVSAK